jgi:GDPmannose 4,6-dehydratase
MNLKKALITGITGQDGSYLAEFLLKKNYQVHGIIRRSSSLNTERINHLYQGPFEKRKRLFLHYGDMVDGSSLSKIINDIMPDEIYNLAAQSHVAVSFELPEYTANCDGLGVLRLCEIIKNLKKKKKIKLYQAGTSELFGGNFGKPQNEKTRFYPRSPYAAAKLYAHWICVNYREAYKIHASNGILFNHESPRRGDTFVTKKIIKSLCEVKKGKKETLVLGNLEAKRDWGHAKEYVEAMWKIIQLKYPDDFVISTGKQYSVKNFLIMVLKKLKIKYQWRGKGLNTKVYDKETKRVIIRCDKKYFRPTEVDNLLGDAKKAKKILNWKPKITIEKLVEEMIAHEMQ